MAYSWISGTRRTLAVNAIEVPDLSITNNKIAPLAVTNDKILSVDASKITGTITPTINTITIDKFKTEILEKNKIYTHDNNGVPVLWFLCDILNDNVDTEFKNKLHANQINFNSILEYNSGTYTENNTFFDQPIFHNSIWYRDGNGNFSVGKIKTEFFNNTNDINGALLFINGSIPVTAIEDAFLKLNGLWDMQGNINLNGYKVINASADPTWDYDLTNKFYVDTSINNLWFNYLKIDGSNFMLNDLNLNNNRLINVIDPVLNNDGMNKNYADAHYIQYNQNINMFNAYRVINSVDPNPLIPWDLITVGFLNNKLTNEYVKRSGDI